LFLSPLLEELPEDPLRLTAEEEQVLEELRHAFMNSVRLRHHMDFLFSHGSMYLCVNENLLFHGCIPLDEDGNCRTVEIYGKRVKAKGLFDCCEELVRQAGGIVAGKMAVLAEGDAADRDDIIVLQKLPLFNADGSIKA
jgi:fructose-1,6-bisphosphatase